MNGSPSGRVQVRPQAATRYVTWRHVSTFLDCPDKLPFTEQAPQRIIPRRDTPPRGLTASRSLRHSVPPSLARRMRSHQRLQKRCASSQFGPIPGHDHEPFRHNEPAPPLEPCFFQQVTSAATAPNATREMGSTSDRCAISAAGADTRAATTEQKARISGTLSGIVLDMKGRLNDDDGHCETSIRETAKAKTPCHGGSPRFRDTEALPGMEAR